MSIRKSNDIANESDSSYANQRSKRISIEERFDDTTHNDNPYDDSIQYLSKKVDEIVDQVNTNSAGGSQGPQGATGPAGADGATGPQGAAGSDGRDGTNGNSHLSAYTFTKDRSNNLVISDGSNTWTIAADR